MKVRTFSIVAGSMACQARCPFCVAHMTPKNGIGSKAPDINWRNFKKACQFARDGGCSTAMITSKGEPTIFPDQVSEFLQNLAPFNFPVIELQTNGLLIADGPGNKVTDQHLKDWYNAGLTTVAISVSHYDADKNKEIYMAGKKDYMDLPALIAKLHRFGFSVRLAVVMVKGYIDSVAEVEKMIAFAQANKVEQLTFRPVTKPDKSENEAIFKWTSEHHVPAELEGQLNKHLSSVGNSVLELAHGATVYDVRGQNVCMTNCLTIQPDNDELRQVIFFPDGHLRYAWQYSGAVIF
ncbi:MAG: radical SAM protein [Candidatus Obscuribacter sp.]|jgi:molybdenum cofactor biosynthesis enzyme MoaA|nr:radical SAM protein [Candidatus Obscuribacter sp.]MBK7838402.1 radical SAM protein [Candidatus Obscuribacter sp.]MBK9201092.1 radical SAM protein [Candidatus Obscuribacter sp.]MBK9621757.1 radical SAM protein [Candidatus Obscuribacter sp.]